MLVRIVVATGLLVAPLFAAAQVSGSGWTVDSRSGCGVVNPHPQPNETISWSGGCVNGLADGTGVLQWFENGRPSEHYEGEMRGGEMNGHGVLIMGNGGRYDGAFRSGKAEGFGTWTTARDSFSGVWKNGCFSDGTKRAWVGGDAASCP